MWYCTIVYNICCIIIYYIIVLLYIHVRGISNNGRLFSFWARSNGFWISILAIISHACSFCSTSFPRKNISTIMSHKCCCESVACPLRKEVGDKFEIIFCSGDRDPGSFKGYYEEQQSKGGHLASKCSPSFSRWWFQILFIFIPTWGRFPFGLIFFKWVETTNQFCWRNIMGKHPDDYGSVFFGTAWCCGKQCKQIYLWEPSAGRLN